MFPVFDGIYSPTMLFPQVTKNCPFTIFFPQIKSKEASHCQGELLAGLPPSRGLQVSQEALCCTRQ